MTARAIDPEKLRGVLRNLRRGDLLIIAERATALLPRAKLQAVIGDRIRLDDLAMTPKSPVSLLDEVRRFHAASLRGDYYESFDVDSKNFMEKSEGTQAFEAEFDHLVKSCIRAALRSPRGPVREAFEILFALLRHIDEGLDDVVFFADEAGSWQVAPDWRTTLAAYFRCLADTASPEEFARQVDGVIKEFDEYDRPRHLTAARRVASAAQKSALRAYAKARTRKIVRRKRRRGT